MDAEDELTHEAERDEPPWSLHPGPPGTHVQALLSWGFERPNVGQGGWEAVALTAFPAQEAR